MKKKFNQLVKKHTPIKINERISKFQELIAGDECVTGSGRCGTHNTKQPGSNSAIKTTTEYSFEAGTNKKQRIDSKECDDQ